MKLREAVSWLMGTLQRNLIPGLEACGERPLTAKEQQLVNVLELVQIEKFVGRPPRRFGRKPWERQALARGNRSPSLWAAGGSQPRLVIHRHRAMTVGPAPLTQEPEESGPARYEKTNLSGETATHHKSGNAAARR